MCRERQLAYHIRLMAVKGGAGAWRLPLAGQPLAAELLRRRGCRALAVNVPLPTTGIDPTQAAVTYMGSVAVNWRMATSAPSAATSAPAPSASARPAAPQPLHRQATPPPLHEQPAKRSRLCSQDSSESLAVRAAVPALQVSALAAAEPSTACRSEPHSAPAHRWEPAAADMALSEAASCCSSGTQLGEPADFAATSCGAARSGRSSPLSSWLAKIRSMLSPASRLDAALVY